jgi:peptidoglycan/xylan/chitin deacetylase (PgdA/CDA1 family)
MFEASGRFVLFDYFRVPYERADGALDGVVRVSVAGEEPALYCPTGELLAAKAGAPALYSLDSIPLPGRVLDEHAMGELAAMLPGEWKPGDAVRGPAGEAASAVWRSDDGGVLLPFDPNEVVASFWTERYVELGSRARAGRAAASVARRGYYVVRPLLARGLQIRLRRAFARLQQKTRFPRWPVETALDDLFTFLFGLVAGLAGRPVPYIGLWPGDAKWAFVLTHDVEQRVGYENVHALLDVELDEGYRSSWNFVPRNGYDVERSVLEELRDRGFEIGVHGLYHDGRDVLPRALAGRRPGIRAYAEQWEAVGFRSPATIRSAAAISSLGFDYDSSYSDTAPFEPQSGGCCTWLPYMIEDTVELPITLVQDHTLFDVLQHTDATMWLEKANLLREHGGMALVLTHPDYVELPHLVESYRRLLREFAHDTSAWKALPRDVSAWWRRRSQSTLDYRDGEWQVAGPAAGEARIEFIGAADTAAHSS